MLAKQAGPFLVAAAGAVLITLWHPLVGALLFAVMTAAAGRRFTERRVLTIAFAAATLVAIIWVPRPF